MIGKTVLIQLVQLVIINQMRRNNILSQSIKSAKSMGRIITYIRFGVLFVFLKTTGNKKKIRNFKIYSFALYGEKI